MKTKKRFNLSDLGLGDNQKTDSLKPKRQYPRFKDNLSHYFTSYSSNTGIHGMKYMGEHDRLYVERCCWLILFSISLYFGAYSIQQQWYKWNNSPVIVSFAQSPTSIWQIPFPAITICPETKFKQSKFNFTYYHHRFQKHIKGEDRLSSDELKNYAEAALLCDINNNNFVGVDNITDSSVTDFLVDIAPKSNDLLYSCFLTGANRSCPDLFHPTITEDGVCFTANMLDSTEIFSDNTDYMKNFNEFNNIRLSQEWTLEKGYSEASEVETFPFRVIFAGARAGLFMVITFNKSEHNSICRGPVDGFKVLLHNPAEFPQIGKQYFRVPFGEESIINIKPTMLTTSEGLRRYRPHQRKCYFSDEKPLNFFKVYTQQNCQTECLTNYTLDICGCAAFYMPHGNNTNICGLGRKRCTIEAENEFLAKEVVSGISLQGSQNIKDQSASCDCLPACFSLIYNSETTQGEFNFREVFEALKDDQYIKDNPGVQMSRIQMFFKEPQFIMMQRNELYGQTDFLANCGGLLGLFTGFSTLSVVEILYYLTLRLSCNLRKYGRRYWSGSKDLLENDAYFHK